MQDLLTALNKEQRKAVIHPTGPLLIIAGAGTGKTKVITHRIAHLITSKLARPEEILAVTFTEKAANEMEERVDRLIPYSYSFVEICTFNSFGERVLRNYGHELGYYLDFKLLDEVEQAIFFRENLFRLPLRFYRPLSSPTRHIQELLAAIRRLKQEDIRPEEYLAFARKSKNAAGDEAELETASKHHEVALVYKKYQKLLKSAGMIDFEDQVVLAMELFRTRPSIRKEFQERYKYILVDEFQDTNYIQFEMLQLLSGTHRNITVVGDDDQSIFRFRGASLSNILNFRRIYPEAVSIVINKNYRSTQDILDAAYRLIRHNNPDRLEVSERIDKSLQAIKKAKKKNVHMLQFDTLSSETDRIADIIQEKVKQGAVYKDFAILVRRNADADLYLRALNTHEIPFRFSGSRGLYSKDEIRVLLAFIQVVTDFEDSRSLFYLAQSAIYQMPVYDLTLITNYAHKKNRSLHEVFKSISRGRILAGISAAAVDIVKKIFSDLLYYIKLSARQNAGQVLYAFFERSGYLKSLIEQKDIAAELKIKNIRIFFDKVKNYSDLTDNDSLYAFAGHLGLLRQVGDNPATAEADMEEDAVSVLTVHKAKGLEFPVVFLVSLIADRYPGTIRREKIPVPDDLLKDKLLGVEQALQRLGPESHTREERRLFYVGMTRAKESLYLTWAQDYGLQRRKKVSPFVLEALDLRELPERVVRSSVLEEIKKYSSAAEPEVQPKRKPGQAPLPLSFFQVDDYLTCPLKYKYRHIIRLPVLPHYTLIYGRVLHDVIHFFLKKLISGNKLSLSELLIEYSRRWVNEGYLSREHEEKKKDEGEQALRLFFLAQQKSEMLPYLLEKSFKWQEGNIRFSGRWDRVDLHPEGAVITDFKASSVKDQAEADKRARDSLQLDLYALSFLKTQGHALLGTRLYFLESGLVGKAGKGEKEVSRALQKIHEAETGLLREDFSARAGWHNCSYCEFNHICPHSYAY